MHKKIYIGQTGRLMKFRIADHRGYIQTQVTSKATGHRLANMKFTILEQVKYNDIMYREERESYFINKFDTFHHGMNREN